jgi:5'-phosphate synthase pdxT subunit
VEVLASVDDHPVAVRQRNVLALSFHPELTGERRLHQLLLAAAEANAQPEMSAGARVRSA